MRFSTAAAALSLPLLAAADVPDYQAQFQGYWDKFQSWIPNPSKHDPVAAAEAKAGSLNLDILTLDNYKEVLYGPVHTSSKLPEEWWVLITGGNKTCFGHCARVEKAFNETAAKFSVTPGAPHTALLNCDQQPVLCNSWSAPCGSIWGFEMEPHPAPINIYTKRLNLTTVTSQDIVDLQKKGIKTEGRLLESAFHPFNGFLADKGLAVPVGYVLWAFNVVPSWVFMIGVSMISRTLMGNRMAGPQPTRNAGARPPAAGQAAPRR